MITTPSDSIYYRFAGQKYRAQVMTFHGGEEHVQLPPGETYVDEAGRIEPVFIVARLRCSRDVIELLMTTEALKKRYPYCRFHLKMPYLPYARQDRRCNVGEAFSLKVFTGLINSQGYASVTVYDCHSHVGTGLLDNCGNVDVATILGRRMHDVIRGKTLVSPDAGANSKVFEAGKQLGCPVVRADKVRDPATGEITFTKVLADDLQKAEVFVIDDICDGGRTFVELAKSLKKVNAGKMSLYVTHGIFSNGFDELLSYYDHIYTTNSFYRGSNKECVTVISI